MGTDIEVKKRSLFASRLAKAKADPAFRTKQRREMVAAHLSAAIAGLGISRSRVAEKAKIKPAQLSRQLSGNANLTLDTIGKICDAVGLDFDVVYRLAGQERTRQPWERVLSVSTTWRNIPPLSFSTDQKVISLSLMKNIELAKSRPSGPQRVTILGDQQFISQSEVETIRA